MKTITIPKDLIKNDDLVIMPRREYEGLRDSAIPTYYLKNEEALEVDSLVDEGLMEYRTGKCTTIKSIADLD